MRKNQENDAGRNFAAFNGMAKLLVQNDPNSAEMGLRSDQERSASPLGYCSFGSRLTPNPRGKFRFSSMVSRPIRGSAQVRSTMVRLFLKNHL
jgi:hypothetical protein